MSSSEYTEIDGEHTTARVMGLAESELENNVIDQLQTIVDAEAFTEPVRVMPDTHVGSGCTIGFTMPLNVENVRVCPSSIGVDIGCGLLAVQLSDWWDRADEQLLEQIDNSIRDVVPTGRSAHNNTEFHMGEDFDWDACDHNWATAKDSLGLDGPEWFEGYGLDEYFKPLCERIEYDPMRAINSMGTLGGGNHFIELAEDENGQYWIVLHSGSRGIGLSIAQYWQDRATERRTDEWIADNLPPEYEQYIVPDLDDGDLTEWFLGGKGQSYIDSDAIRSDFSGQAIEEVHNAIREAHPNNRNDNENLDYLEGQQAAGYIVDMIFAQTYAWQNRLEMIDLITDAISVGVRDGVHSPHNLIDFNDLVLRKGATRAHEGERFVLPFNMAHGTLICEGKGNEAWNRSAPHGAGRVMSRTQAFNEIDMDEFKEQMDGIYSTSVTEDTMDEAPDAYKSASMIANAIEPTAEIVHRLHPVLNIKALE